MSHFDFKKDFFHILKAPTPANIKIAAQWLVDEMEVESGRDVYNTFFDSCMEALLQAGIDANASFNKKTLLTHFSRLGGVDVVKNLVSAGAQVDPPRPSSPRAPYHTPLMLAASEGHESIAQFLLESGAKVDLTDEEGETAIFWAAREGWVSMMHLLYEAGANLSHRRQDGEDLLQVAFDTQEEKSEEDLVDVLGWLIDKGLDPLTCGSRAEGIIGELDELHPSIARDIRAKISQQVACQLDEQTAQAHSVRAPRF